MFGEKSVELVRDLLRSRDPLPPPKDETVRMVFEEMKALFEENQREVSESIDEMSPFQTSVQLRHTTLMWNKRCMLAYFYNRLQKLGELRWSFGSILPPDISTSMSEAEVRWFQTYNRNLLTYMSSLGDGTGMDLTKNRQPPKSFYVQVRCLTDYGDYELEDGTIINLNKNSTHLLPLSCCEKLIRQGILEHVTS